MPQNCTIFHLRREETWSAILWSKNFDSIKWPTVLVRDVKENGAISRHVWVDYYIIPLKHISNHFAFYNKRFQTLFKDHPV